MDSRIRVVVRKRPLNPKEEERGDLDVVEVRDRQVTFREARQRVDLTHYTELHRFTFDAAYPEHASNQDLYAGEVRPLLQEAFRGANVTCFAYGQTGSGKTYTMLGKKPFVKGVYANAVADIFKFVATDSKFGVTVAFY
jgi:kinesin family protein 2/24